MSQATTSLTCGIILIGRFLKLKPKKRAREFVIQYLTQTKPTQKRGSLESVSNIVNIEAFKANKYQSADPSLDFIIEHLIPWANTRGLDTTNSSFKNSAAAILTILQGMHIV